MKDGKRHGRGGKYDGEWKDDKRHGWGTLTGANGVYDGEWKDGAMHGRGTMTYADGTEYDGEWKDGKKNGRGTMTYPDRAKYDGEWKDGKRHGRGTMTYADGTEYDGEWKDGKENGRGTLTFPDGAKYDGEWQNGRRNGPGVLTEPDGTVYIGEWRPDAVWSGEPPIDDLVSFIEGKGVQNHKKKKKKKTKKPMGGAEGTVTLDDLVSFLEGKGVQNHKKKKKKKKKKTKKPMGGAEGTVTKRVHFGPTNELVYEIETTGKLRSYRDREKRKGKTKKQTEEQSDAKPVDYTAKAAKAPPPRFSASWTAAEVAAWICARGFPDVVAEAMEQQDIDGNELRGMLPKTLRRFLKDVEVASVDFTVNEILAQRNDDMGADAKKSTVTDRREAPACPICFEDYTEQRTPRIISCGHTVWYVPPGRPPSVNR